VEIVHSAVAGRRPATPAGDLPDPQPPVWRWGDPIALSLAIALITVSALVGRDLNERGLPIVLPSPPLVAIWDPHLGWGTPLAIGCLLVGLRLQRLAAGVAWQRLLLAGWLLNLAWMCSLTLIDGLRQGWIEVLLNPNEYLHDLPRIANPVSFLATFTDFIAFTDPVAGVPEVWTTHVAAHPPLATLIFWWLDQVGLSGGFWAGALCIVVSSVAAVGLPVALRELGAEAAARRIVPFVALFPGAVWMAVSADGLFAGVALGGLALVCIGATRGRLVTSLAGGLLLGVAVFLSYGLVLFGLVVLLIFWLTVRRHGLRHSLVPWLVAVAGFLAVVAVHLAFGFNWLTGLSELRIRYYQGIASQRPFSYFVYANLAAWLISCSPLLAIGIARSVAVLVRGRLGAWSQDRVVALLALSGVLAALVADLSALSKAETERIWLSFGVVAYAGLALLRGRAAALALIGCAGWALTVNHLLDTGW
jgi:methylthioxylose transferase